VGLDLLADADAFAVRQRRVEQDEVRTFGAREPQGVVARGRLDDLIALAREHGRVAVPQPLVVFDY
jgi:hypothetical protein